MSTSAIQDYLDTIGVDYKTRGTDVGRNDLNIDCPWCGKEKHLAIHRTTGSLNCWACQFMGLPRRPWLATLIQELERIPYPEAKDKAKQLTDGSWSDRYSPELFARPESTWWPASCYKFFEPIRHPAQERAQHVARRYLNKRAISDRTISDRGLRFTLPESTDGWEGRVIVPYWEAGEAVCWTGRDYTGINHLRYRNCPVDKSTRRIKELLYGLDLLKQHRLTEAHVVEGVFDQLTLGPGALAVSKGGASPEQQRLLIGLKLTHLNILFDPTTEQDRYSLLRAVELARSLAPFVRRLKVVRLAAGDVNELGADRVRAEIRAAPFFQG